MKFYSRKIANVIREYLEDGWHYKFFESLGMFWVRMGVPDELQECFCIIDVQQTDVVVCSSAMTADPKDPEMMAQVAEYVCRINYKIKNGAFEVDYRNGKIHYRNYIDCEDVVPSKAIITNSIHCVFEIYVEFVDGFNEIIDEKHSAKEAYEHYEEAQRRFEKELITVEDLLRAFGVEFDGSGSGTGKS